MEYKDYYATMGVSRNATQDEVKRAYRRLARRYHPDRNAAPDAEQRFKALGEAYEVLKDSDRRAAYDSLGAGIQAGQSFRPPPGWDPGTTRRTRHSNSAHRGGAHAGVDGGAGFSEFFETLFGAGLGPGSPGGGTRRQRAGWGAVRVKGRNQTVGVEISLEDAFHGAERTLTIQDAPAVDGRSPPARSLKVRIPPGTGQGQSLRLEGQGRPGHGGAPNGDLVLEIRLAPHPLYAPEGRDIHMVLPVTPWEAALGARVQVPTLGGPVEVQVPPGSQSGTRLRLQGRGLPGHRTGVPSGDQLASLRVVLPPGDTAHARALYRRMEAELPFDPRAGL